MEFILRKAEGLRTCIFNIPIKEPSLGSPKPVISISCYQTIHRMATYSNQGKSPQRQDPFGPLKVWQKWNKGIEALMFFPFCINEVGYGRTARHIGVP